MNSRNRRGPSPLLLLPLSALGLLVGAGPYASAVVSSLSSGAYGEWTWAGTANYAAILADRGFFASLGISLAWAAISSTLVVGCGFALASAMLSSKKVFAIAYPALLVPWIVPIYIGAPIFRMLVHGRGGDSLLSALTGLRVNLLTDAAPAFVSCLAASLWMGLPVATMALYAAMAKSGRSVLEAARLEGASGLALARAQLWPEARGAAAALFAFQLLSSFKEFSLPYLMTAGGPSLRAGIMEKTVVGATTTAELYVYDLYKLADKPGLPAALAVALGLVVALAAIGKALVDRHVAGKGGGRGNPFHRPSLPAALTWNALRAVVVVFLCGSSLAVLASLAWLSLSGVGAISIDSFLPRALTFRNFPEVLVQGGLARALANSLAVSGAAALLCPLLALPAAAWMARARKGSRELLFAGLQALGSSSGMHALAPMYALFSSLGIAGGFLPVILVYAFHSAPLAAFSLSAFLQGVPPEFEEAARLEGASTAYYLRKVLLPLAVPPLLSAMGLAFLSAWNGFLVPLVFLDDEALYTVGVRLQALVGPLASSSPRWQLFAAGSIVSLTVAGALFLRFKRPLSRSDISEGG